MPAAEVELGCEAFSHGRAELGQLAEPDLLPDRAVGAGEVNLEQEAAFKGLVEVSREVGGGDEDPPEILQLFQQDILYQDLGMSHSV